MKKDRKAAVFILKLFAGVFICLLFSCAALSPRAAARSYAVSGEKPAVDWRSEMRNFVIAIAEAAHKTNPGFELIVQNAQELITSDGLPDSPVMSDYLNAIAGTGREDLYFGYTADNKPTPGPVSKRLKSLCDIFVQNGKAVLVVDYCTSPAFIDSSYKLNRQNGYISFAANKRDLSSIPPRPAEPFNKNDESIERIAQAKNFLYLINPENFASKDDFIRCLAATDYDAFVIDLFFDGTALESSDVKTLQYKKSRARRKVIAYMSIGEAESYRYYWKDEWNKGLRQSRRNSDRVSAEKFDSAAPEWLKGENPAWKENFKVDYRDSEWQDIIYKGDNSYLQKILDAGFDGVYLDIVDAFEYFENGEKE
ncbi:endo alpha-1,4 polygalactosaminidase [Treponema sp. OMZ 840]|uniref:endo alpha-1,4 polygalactosaminidase n=1 Tax=Treponema sp. OMZ 840 TaxID=244313 RepID=UPI003D8A8551